MMSKPVVVLDPGHGGYDPGASYNGLQEKELNLLLAIKTAERLDGVTVLLTRERDIYVSLADRVALSSRVGPALFLSLHANAGGGRGFESFIYSGLGAKDPAAVKQAAVHGQVMAALSRWNIVDRGRKKAAFYVLKHNPAPAVLIENLFIDNTREAQIWREPPFVEALAGGVARGIKAALGLPVEGRPGPGLDHSPDNRLPGENGEKSSPTLLAEDKNKALYTVQIGAFAYIENARQRLAEAQQAGFSDAYIYRKLH